MALGVFIVVLNW